MSNPISCATWACLTALLAVSAPLQAQTPPAPAASSITGDPQQNVTNKSRDPKATGTNPTPMLTGTRPAAPAQSASSLAADPQQNVTNKPREPQDTGTRRPGATPSSTVPGASRPSTKTNAPAPETQRRPDPVPAGSSPASASR